MSMVASTVVTDVSNTSDASGVFTLDDFMLNPPDHMEWVDGKLVEKTGMTLKHGAVQARLSAYWRNYMAAKGGEVYTDVPCRTQKRGRRPDVAYLTPGLLEQVGQVAVLPQSFPLVAEIVSPTDEAEAVFAKAQEYLQAGCEEVWLVLPENRYVFVMTQQQRLWFVAGEVVNTQSVLQGFSVAIDELLA